jgi:hypothetical protein
MFLLNAKGQKYLDPLTQRAAMETIHSFEIREAS